VATGNRYKNKNGSIPRIFEPFYFSSYGYPNPIQFEAVSGQPFVLTNGFNFW
jgi:hypothetical protein